MWVLPVVYRNFYEFCSNNPNIKVILGTARDDSMTN